ncbi:MAG: serine/threonine-protein kinase [Victivallales bacterium]
MSTISFECPGCHTKLVADNSLCGSIISCKDCGNSVVIPIPGITEGMKIGDFLLKSKLGTGGMGEVWLAYHAAMDRHVALKILSPKFTSNKVFLERFAKEAKNSGKLHHPNIVTAFHAGVENGVYYLAISYVDGKNLRDRLDNGEIILEREALLIAKSIIDALDYAWGECKIVHRDIKPANIIIDRKGVAKVLDLGISKSIDEDNSLTMTGTFVGTPFYMSPEQALGDKNIDFRADIYSLGATLYHMVTGTVPFDASTAMAIISRHLKDPLPPANERNPALSNQCCTLLEVMMAKRREERPQSWQEMREDVELVLKGQFPKTVPPKKEEGQVFIASDSEQMSKAKTAVSPDQKTIAGTDQAVQGELKEPEAVESRRDSQGVQPPKSRTSWKLAAILVIFFLLMMAVVAATAFILVKKYYFDAKKSNRISVEEINSSTGKNTRGIDEPTEKELQEFLAMEAAKKKKPEQKSVTYGSKEEDATAKKEEEKKKPELKW